MNKNTLDTLQAELSTAFGGIQELTSADVEHVCGGMISISIGDPGDSGSTWSQCHVDGLNDDDPS